MYENWSDELLEETRTALNNGFVGPDGFLHMKNINGYYGKIRLEDLRAGKLLIQDKQADRAYQFSTCDEMMSSGWAID
jgi:hypothetical protein